MFTVKVRKIGNSMGIVLPKEALAKLNVKEGQALYLTEAADGYRVTPYNEEFENQMKAAEEIMNNDRDILRELSKR